jgi:hypothetical protein
MIPPPKRLRDLSRSVGFAAASPAIRPFLVGLLWPLIDESLTVSRLRTSQGGIKIEGLESAERCKALGRGPSGCGALQEEGMWYCEVSTEK